MRATVRQRGVWVRTLWSLGCGLALLFSASTAQAAPLGLTPGNPDIYSAVNVSYLGGIFSVTSDLGAVGQLKPGLEPIPGLQYTLSAPVDATGASTGPGSFSIFGEIPLLGLGPTTLVSGDLTDFGFLFDATSPGFGMFEFLFDVTGSDPLGFGAKGGIILTSFDLTGVDFSSNFSGTSGLTSSDTFSVPEPSSMLLLTIGTFGLAARRKYLERRS